MDQREPRSRYDPSLPPHQPPPTSYPRPLYHPHIHPPPPPLPSAPHHPRDRHPNSYPHPDASYLPYPRVHPHEPWDSVDVDPREIRAFHDCPVQLDWDHDLERRIYGRVAKDEALEEDFRVRVRKDKVLEDEFRVREQGMLDEGFRDRIMLRIRKDGSLEEDFSPRIFLPKVSDPMRNGNSDIGFHGNMYMENKINKDGIEEKHYMGGKGKRQWADMGDENYGFRENQENINLGNIGKRMNFNVGCSQHNEWNLPKKTSALCMIQNVISVWNRIAEEPSSPFPLPCDSTQLGFVEDNQPEIELLDLSYKSNVLVAKAVVPSSPNMQPTSEGKCPTVVVPKDRMKMKKVVNDREQVVIPIVSRIGEGVQRDVSKPLADGSKKAIGSYNKPASDGTKKAIGSTGKPFTSKKGIGSTSKPANDGPKKAAGPSNKPAIGFSSQPPNKVIKAMPVKKIPVKRAVKAVKNNINVDRNLAGKVNKSKPNIDASSSLCQPGLTAVKTSTENSLSEQSGKDVVSLHMQMEETPSIKDNASEKLTKDGTSADVPTVVTTSTEVQVTEGSNNDQGLMIVSGESIAVEKSMIDANFVEALMVGTASSEKLPMEQSGKDVNLVQEPMVAPSSTENCAMEESGKDVNLVQDNVVGDNLKEDSTTLAKKLAHGFTGPVVSDTRIVMDVSSDSSSEDVTVISSPDSKAICSVYDGNDEASSKKIDVSCPLQSDAEVCLSYFDESSAFGLFGDAQIMRQATVSVVTVTSPNFHDSLQDDSGKKKILGIKKQCELAMPVVRDKSEFLGEQISSSSDVRLPNNACDSAKCRNPLICATNEEDYDLGFLVRELQISDGVPVFEDCSVNVAMSERMEQLLPSSLSQKGTLTNASRAQDASTFVMTNQCNSQLSVSKCVDDNGNTNREDEKPTGNNDSLFCSGRLLASETEPGTKSDKTMECYPSTSEKSYVLEPQELKKQISADTKLTGATTTKKPVMSSGVPRVFINQSSSSGSLKEVARLGHNARNKTWHRTDTPSSASRLHGKLQSTVYKQSAKKQSPKKLGRVLNSSYVRKGNSLIRKPVNVVAHPILPHSLDAPSKKSQVDRSTDVRSIDNTKNCFNPSLERPTTPPLPVGSKILSCTAITEKEFPQLMIEDPAESGVEAQVKSAEGHFLDLLSTGGDNLSVTSGIMSEPFTGKRMTYVKHKSNQLLAHSQLGHNDSSARRTENNEKLSSSTLSDFCYMRKKNKLILNSLSLDAQHKQDGIVPIGNSKSSDQGVSNVSSLESSRTSLFKKSLNKGVRKAHKHSKFSRVWTLSGKESGKKDLTSLNGWKVIPYLFPWKRTKYCKFPRSKTALNSNRISVISWKLQLARKRDTLYTVSIDGFSLRRAGVVSIGGSSLKWSKSIDRNSKKANEEATLAVAEAERKKRRKSFGSREKNVHSFTCKSTLGIELQQGERVFRVGSFRYKMDASKQTLIRIPGTVGQQSGKNTFVPRRLLIDNDEYIRMGNGSQLVRDPKKFVRILASEKVRWSLHTARLRLAKTQQYCQFFTRFGKCNKNSGKCSYIHDPEKVAICTKFLRGVCTDDTCKLTHKIIPERMPDCSYFLRGLCTNISCPYRHVHVNPKTSVCDGFLRGYCADGDEISDFEVAEEG